MRHLKISYFSVFTALAFFTLLPSCDKDDDANNDGNGNDNGGSGEEKVWVPYDFEDHNTAIFSFTYEGIEDGEVESEGYVDIEINDPAVTISGEFDGEQITFTSDGHDQISQNFMQVMSGTPFYAAFYTSFWPAVFGGENIAVGASWTYSNDDINVSTDITGEDTYGGIEGYVVEIAVEENNNETAYYDLCINTDMPVPIMTQFEQGNMRYRVELTDYQN